MELPGTNFHYGDRVLTDAFIEGTVIGVSAEPPILIVVQLDQAVDVGNGWMAQVVCLPENTLTIIKAQYP